MDGAAQPHEFIFIDELDSTWAKQDDGVVM